MKKSVILAAFGLLHFANVSSGVGYVFFSSYLANNVAGALTYTSSSQLSAQLYYALGTVSDPVNLSLVTSWTSNVGPGFTALSGTVSYMPLTGYGGGYEGYFDSGIVSIPGYVSGPITFEVVAFNGSSYANSTARGRSGSFTMNSIPSSPVIPAPALGDNGQPMPYFFASGLDWTPPPIPEPTTLILTAVGGLSLIRASRGRK